MNLKFLTDEQLIKDLKNFTNQERVLLTQILYHLKELDIRKLFSSLGYKSLYEYACVELQYSTDQAYRRIQAMRLLKEIPEISNQINSGALSLSNISQAQRYFNESKTVDKTEKLMVLKQLENKSVREAQKELLSLVPEKPLPLEIKKQITPTKVNVNFIMSEELEAKLEEVKSLMGPKGVGISLADLVENMANLSLEKLKEKKFSKKRVLHEGSKTQTLNPCDSPKITRDQGSNEDANLQNNKTIKKISIKALSINSLRQASFSSKNLDVKKEIQKDFFENLESIVQNKITNIKPNNSRYISAELKHQIWKRDHGRCTKCTSTRNLNFDHIKPWALGGETKSENLRLLCFHCNQRLRIEAKL